MVCACVWLHRSQDPSSALQLFTTVLASEPNNVRALHGKAVTLDKMADVSRSNARLEEAIQTYRRLLLLGPLLDDNMFLVTAKRCINRMRFKGDHLKAVEIHNLLIERYPKDPKYRNELAVTYLMVNRIPEARHHLEATLKGWPNDGFALAHLGFILKTTDNKLPLAVDYLTRGIASRAEGTIDGRFFFQLGDALSRLGRSEEATKINQLGVREGVFLSEYQRSLYNVNRLKGNPWWNLQDTTYKQNFDKLEANWKIIQQEGLAALLDKKNNLFQDESESLRDVGDWKQLELFARGRKLVKNCAHTPRTCQLISDFPAARDCRRGQVKFSVMEPGTHVFPHCGPTNCRLRAHLGLAIPPGTAIRVAEETRSWQEGKIIIFDDSFEHEVWHNGTTMRLVLIVDVWHPQLTEEERKTLPAI